MTDKKLEALFKEYGFGYICGKCSGQGSGETHSDMCPACGRQGIVNWQTTKLAKAINELWAKKCEGIEDKIWEIFENPTKANKGDFKILVKNVAQAIKTYLLEER